MNAHCQHCEPECVGGTVSDTGTIYYHEAAGDRFTWSPDYGCPVCRNVALLREMADDGDARVAHLAQKAAVSLMYGEALESSPDLKDAMVIRAGALTLRAAADEIEAGQ